MKRLLLGVLLLMGCRPKLCSIEGSYRRDKVNLVLDSGKVTWNDSSGEVRTGSYYPDYDVWRVSLSCSFDSGSYEALCDESGQAIYLQPAEYSSDSCSLAGVYVKQSTTPMKGVVCAPDGSGCACTQALVTEAPDVCDTTEGGTALCCADYGWPSSGGCSCRSILCDTNQPAPGTCLCYPGHAGGSLPQTACIGSTVCCYSSSNDWCKCYSGNTVCGTGYTTVTSCNTPKYKCSASTVSKTSCSSP